jgi:hypothetical protein
VETVIQTDGRNPEAKHAILEMYALHGLALPDTPPMALHRGRIDGDRDCPITYEPSGQDFLSPCLAEADVMRRVLPPNEFATWLTAFLPRLPTTDSGAWLPIGVVNDKTDGELAHLDGLNLSRAWMLGGNRGGIALRRSARTRIDRCGPYTCRQWPCRRDWRALGRRSLARQLRRLPHYAPRYR